MLQLDLARRWKNRIVHEVTSAAEETEQVAAHERLAQMIDYINTINVPKRSSAYDKDLHSLYTV